MTLGEVSYIHQYSTLIEEFGCGKKRREEL